MISLARSQQAILDFRAAQHTNGHLSQGWQDEVIQLPPHVTVIARAPRGGMVSQPVATLRASASRTLG